MDRLLNKIALITGSAQGIGEATAELFHKEGATVIVSDINDLGGKAVAQRLGDRSRYYHLDVSIEDQWRTLFGLIEGEYGRLDILINNAGIDGYPQTKRTPRSGEPGS